LWFDNQAEEAVKFYTSVFRKSTIKNIIRYGKGGFEIHKQPEGRVMTMEFEIEGQSFVALNGGPVFKFTEAISFQVMCDTQEEVDYYWSELTPGGDEKARQCGWLKDKYGISWQIIPKELSKYIGGRDPGKAQSAVQAMLQMKKIEIDEIKKAYENG